MNLEPCPFCGAKAEMSFSAWQVRCTQCVCTGKTFRTKEHAIDWWNTRKARQPLTDEELREALRSCPHDTVENLRVRWLYAKDFARAIERAHGIGVSDK